MSDYAKFRAKQRATEVPFNEERFEELYEAAMSDPDPEGDIRVGLTDREKMVNSIIDIVDEYIEETNTKQLTINYEKARKAEIHVLRQQVFYMQNALKEIACGKFLPGWGDSVQDALHEPIRIANHALHMAEVSGK